jgi:hypothetical protein
VADHADESDEFEELPTFEFTPAEFAAELSAASAAAVLKALETARIGIYQQAERHEERAEKVPGYVAGMRNAARMIEAMIKTIKSTQ